MSGPMETCAGLLWIGSRTAPWVCRADSHVYDIRVSQWLEPPPERSPLRWLIFVMTGIPLRFVFVQVHHNCEALRIESLEIEGAPRLLHPWAGRA